VRNKGRTKERCEHNMKNTVKDFCTLMRILLSTDKEEEESSGKFPLDSHLRGSVHQRKRIKACAEFCAQNYEGDLVEIGALYGETTVQLCEVAKKYNRKVIVVDPWDKYNRASQYIDGTEYKIFLETVEDYHDTLEVIKDSSLNPDVFSKIRERQLSFAFVDGDHTPNGLTNDLLMVDHCNGAVAVDDLSYYQNCPCCDNMYSLSTVFSKFSEKNKFSNFINTFWREGYIIKDLELRNILKTYRTAKKEGLKVFS